MNRRTLLKKLSNLSPLLLLGVLSPFRVMASGNTKDKIKKAAAKAKKAVAKATGGKLMGEAEPLANAMKYKHDANDASIKVFRKDSKAFCDNCAKYNVCNAADKACKPAKGKRASLAQGPCQIFMGKEVKGKGWCLSWQKLS